MWSYTTGGDVASSPAVANGVVFVGSYDDNVYALDAVTGALVWSYATGDMVVSSPAVADGMVYVGSYDHMVYAFGNPRSEQIHNVVFTASGLPSGASWSVTFNSQTRSATSNIMVFKALNGVYDFSVSSPSGFVASPSSGSITVDSADENVQVIFTAISGYPSLLEVSIFVLVILMIASLFAVALWRRKR
jgi:outer membrane protein assembly factor BamB